MRTHFRLQLQNAALLVIDMQKYFVDKASRAYVPSADTLTQKIKKLIDTFDKNNRPIIFTRHIDVEGSLMEKWWQENIKEDDPMSEIAHDLEANRGEVVIKHQYDAFLDTNLEMILDNKGVEQVVICGVLTNLCCETTARSAFMRGFEVYFTVDGTATYKKEMHKATLLNLSYGFAIPVTVSEVIKLLRL
jgi:bifunctional isochorismate lyase/aryl carrier protein